MPRRKSGTPPTVYYRQAYRNYMDYFTGVPIPKGAGHFVWTNEKLTRSTQPPIWCKEVQISPRLAAQFQAGELKVLVMSKGEEVTNESAC